VRLASAAVGAAIAGLLWETAKNVFANSIGQSVQYSTIYGSLAVVPIFLIWLYVTWIIVLIGVEISYTHQHFENLVRMRLLGPVRGRDEALLALGAYTLIGARFENGGEPPTVAELSDLLHAPVVAVERQVDDLLSAGLLRRTVTDPGGDGLVPAVPLDTTSASEVIRASFADVAEGDNSSEALATAVSRLLAAYQKAGHEAIADVSARDLVQRFLAAEESAEDGGDTC
jgi:membrane protein